MPVSESPAPTPGWRRAFDELFGLDLRSLGLMRALLGLLVFLDTVLRAWDVRAFYTDVGALPRQAILEHSWSEWRFSFHMASGKAELVLVIFAIQALFALMFAFGWKTRLASVVTWLLVVSVHARAPILLQAGDIVFRVVLFWCMFLPLGERFSVDSLFAEKRKPTVTQVVSVAAVGYLIQIGYVYLFTAILKSGAAWHNGKAVYYALMIDHFAKQPQTSWMLEFPQVLEVLTWATLVWEYVGPFLVFAPLLRGPVRTLTALGFVGLHIGFWFFLEIGFFPWVCMVVWLGVLPGWFWDRLAAVRKRPVEIGFGRLGASYLANGAMVFAIYLITAWNISTIHKEIGRSMPVPNSVRWVAHLTRLDQKWDMFAPYPMKDDGWYRIPGVLLDKTEVDLWTGEAPVWVPVDTSDGHSPLLHLTDTSLELDRTKPEEVSSEYSTQRWRKYMRNLWSKSNKNMRVYLGKHYCRKWNDEHTGRQKLKSFRMIYMKEVTPKPGESTVVEPVQIWEHDCFAKPKTDANPTVKSAIKPPPILGRVPREDQPATEEAAPPEAEEGSPETSGETTEEAAEG